MIPRYSFRGFDKFVNRKIKMAEQNIVDGLQNLRVVAAYDLAVMDDLARDFANALEDFPMTARLRSGGNEQST